MRLYLDASAIIYAIEGVPPRRQAVHDTLVRVEATQGGAVVSSALSRVECLVRPLRDGDLALLAAYEGFLFHGSLGLLPISDAVLDLAAELRAAHRFKTPDALHLATALDARADLFLTGDKGLARCPGLSFEVVPGV